MAPDINDPGGQKNDPDEIRDGVVSDATRFPGGFIDEPITESGAAVQVVGRFQLSDVSFIKEFDVSAQDSTPTGLAFKPDGGQVYISGDNTNNIYQYSLSTAFDVSTASFVRSFDVSTQDTIPNDVDFKPDGSKMYVVGDGNSTIFEYSLSTPFDISTASFSQSLSVNAQDGRPNGIDFKPDGSRLYLIGLDRDNIYQYNLSTAFDVSSATFIQSFDISPQDDLPSGVNIKPNGRQVFISGDRNNNLYQYSLSTAFDISTASFVRSFDVSPQDDGPSGLAFKPDGTYVYVTGRSNAIIIQYAVGVIRGKFV